MYCLITPENIIRYLQVPLTENFVIEIGPGLWQYRIFNFRTGGIDTRDLKIKSKETVGN